MNFLGAVQVFFSFVEYVTECRLSEIRIALYMVYTRRVICSSVYTIFIQVENEGHKRAVDCSTDDS